MGKRLFFVGFSMAFRILYIICLLMLSSELLAQRQMVVVNIESKVPVRDVIVSADDGREVRSSWNGLFEVPDSFERIDFRHPDFEHRYVLKSELLGDTIFLIPNANALSEVVIYGERRFDKRITQMLRSSPEKSLDAQLANIKIPADFNPIGFALWIYDITMRQKVEDRQRRKRGLKEVRRPSTRRCGTRWRKNTKGLLIANKYLSQLRYSLSPFLCQLLLLYIYAS